MTSKQDQQTGSTTSPARHTGPSPRKEKTHKCLVCSQRYTTNKGLIEHHKSKHPKVAKELNAIASKTSPTVAKTPVPPKKQNAHQSPGQAKKRSAPQRCHNCEGCENDQKGIECHECRFCKDMKKNVLRPSFKDDNGALHNKRTQSEIAVEEQSIRQESSTKKARAFKEFLPKSDCVLVERFAPEGKTTSGIMIQETARGIVLQKTVVATGPGSRNKNDEFVPVSVYVGDKVMLREDGRIPLTLKDQEYFLFREKV